MTNFFGINITDNQENSNIDGNIFMTNQITAEQSAEIEQFLKAEEEFNQQYHLPPLLGILRSACQLGWMIILAGIFKAWGSNSDLTFAQGYKNAPVLHWIGLICFIIWLILFSIEKVRRNKVENTEAFAQHIETADTLLHKVKQSLKIPEDSACLDVFAERYILKNNEPKHKDFGMTAFLNLQMFAFIRDGNLCLADTEQVWEIPLSSFRSITLIKKRQNFPDWHKTEPIDSQKYKPYQITANQFGHYFARYYRVEIIDPKGEFYLLIPEYDGELFMELTKLSEN